MGAELTMSSSVRALHGIGPAAEKGLSEAGIRTVQELLDYFPRSYEDCTREMTLEEAEKGKAGFFAVQVSTVPESYTGRSGASVVSFQITDRAGDTASVTVFNQSYLANRLRQGASIYLYGALHSTADQLQFTAPKILTRPPDPPMLGIYPGVGGLSPGRLRAAIRSALDSVQIADPHSDYFLDRYDLVSLRDAYRMVHLPASAEDVGRGLRRFHADACFVLARTLDVLAARRDQINETPVNALSAIDDYCRRLPFEPTGAQKRAMREIAEDLGSSYCMNRLLQGDVGSGKTAVALFAAYAVMRAGYQAIFLAPTEILARQHYEVASRVLSADRVFLITGQTGEKERRRIRYALQTTPGTMVVGTHALLYGELGLHAPALLIADEQHRFGVRQRQTLLNQPTSMHSLTVSATPIPRSLALAVHGQTNVSVLNERPAGRKATQTSYVPPRKISDMFRFISERAAEGKQSFIVCPSIDPDETSGTASAVEIYELLRQRFPGTRFGLLHGRCDPAQKQSVIEAFAAGSVDVLVTTTVIEVGVDIPNASVMVILDAERFGIAQLHQLRGRVGRGSEKSYCFLTTKSEGAMRRIRTLCGTSDGFAIAEADLRERGAGDLWGLRQHGKQSALSILTTENAELLADIRNTLRQMSTDRTLTADYEWITRQAEEKAGDLLNDLALN